MVAPKVTELFPSYSARTQPRIRVANLLVQTLGELGVDTFYGIPGGAISSVYDALIDFPNARVINARHESGAVFMAMGHARSGGSLPCVLMTSGPGITNALTGLAAAHADGVPLIAIGGEVPKKNFGRGALQEGSRYHLDILGMARSVTKYATELTNPRAVATTIRRAVATALSGKQGPVLLSLPLDVGNEEVIPTRSPTQVSTSFGIDHDVVAAAAEALMSSRRAVILAGSGARNPEAVRLIGVLAASLQIPVITTPKAKGLFPETDPLSLGVFGVGGHPSALEYLEGGIDTILCVGCGLGETGTNSWSPLLQASNAFIQIDIDATQIGKNYHVDYGIVGPAQLVLRELAARISRRPTAAPATGIRYYEPEKMEQDTTPIEPARAIKLLQLKMPESTIFTSDVGEHLIYALHYLRIENPGSFIANTGLGSMGSGIGAAIGAKVANPKRPVVSICGDYGFQMFGMEIASCVENRIGVVFAIFNDARMRMVEGGMRTIFGRTPKVDSQRVDFSLLARSVGANGYLIRSAEDLDRVPRQHLVGDIPCVLDFEINPDASFPVNGRVTQIKNFSN
ncbi:MAG: thiamine pyrophosphate-binding protein [Myxococcaceae bacterium]|nr:thiamine pyrophosphate-binding protein [Myxococcaceae bacterium]